MGTKNTDMVLRDRLRAWLKHERVKRSATHPNDQDFARLLGVSKAHLSNMLSGETTIGLDALYKMRERLHLDVNLAFDHDAPAADEENEGKNCEPQISRRA